MEVSCPLTEARHASKLVFQFGDPLPQRSDRDFDLVGCEAWRDMLRAVPVEGLYVDDDATLDSRPVVREGEMADEVVVSIELDDPGAAKELQSRTVRIVHQKQRDAIVRLEVSNRYVLPVA